MRCTPSVPLCAPAGDSRASPAPLACRPPSTATGSTLTHGARVAPAARSLPACKPRSCVPAPPQRAGRRQRLPRGPVAPSGSSRLPLGCSLPLDPCHLRIELASMDPAMPTPACALRRAPRVVTLPLPLPTALRLCRWTLWCVMLQGITWGLPRVAATSAGRATAGDTVHMPAGRHAGVRARTGRRDGNGAPSVPLAPLSAAHPHLLLLQVRVLHAHHHSRLPGRRPGAQGGSLLYILLRRAAA